MLPHQWPLSPVSLTYPLLCRALSHVIASLCWSGFLLGDDDKEDLQSNFNWDAEKVAL